MLLKASRGSYGFDPWSDCLDWLVVYLVVKQPLKSGMYDIYSELKTIKVVLVICFVKEFLLMVYFLDQ